MNGRTRLIRNTKERNEEELATQMPGVSVFRSLFVPSFHRGRSNRPFSRYRAARGFITRLSNAPTAKRENNAKALRAAAAIDKQITVPACLLKSIDEQSTLRRGIIDTSARLISRHEGYPSIGRVLVRSCHRRSTLRLLPRLHSKLCILIACPSRLVSSAPNQFAHYASLRRPTAIYMSV